MNSMRYAHTEGHTDVCYDDTGRYVITSGADGDVRIWDGIDDDDAVSHKISDRIYAIAFKNRNIYTATEDNTVQIHSFPHGEPCGIVTRFSAPVSHMHFNKPGSVMVAGSSDFKLKIVVVETNIQKGCYGHEAPILSVAMDPKEKYFVSSSCDGSVKVWNMKEQKCEKTWFLLPKCNDVSSSKTLCRVCWSREGKYLFVPVLKEIHVYMRNSWDKLTTFSDRKISDIIYVMSLSPDGVRLGLGCLDGTLCIFDVEQQKVLTQYNHRNKLTITALAWNPTKINELAFCDNHGQLGVVFDTPVRNPSDQDVIRTTSTESTEFEDDDDDLLLEAGSQGNIESIKDEVVAEAAAAATSFRSEDEDDNDNQDVPKGQRDEDDNKIREENRKYRPVIFQKDYKPPLLQKAFQPGSTPEHLLNRFMKWNSVGIIRQYSGEDENSIDIEFHDSSTHHSMHISNTMDYTMADLSNEAVVFACAGDDDSPSKLTCMHFGSWDYSKEWTINMPDSEDIVAVTIGEGWIAVATDFRNIRLFTVGGIQLEIFSIPGPVVCLAGGGKQLIIVFHKGLAIPGDQCLGITLIKVFGRPKMLIHEQHLPLSPSATLCWIGFSTEGTPFYMDCSGIVRMWNRGFGGTWVQVANTRDHAKGKSDHYWIVAIHEDPQQLRCIPCKGSRFPPTLPRPAVAMLPFHIPLCEPVMEKSVYEETLFRTRLFANHYFFLRTEGIPVDDSETRSIIQETLMKLFALSARSDFEYRALEVCEMMGDDQTLQLAIRYASRLKHLLLAQRISDLVKKQMHQHEEFRDHYNRCQSNIHTDQTDTGEYCDAENKAYQINEMKEKEDKEEQQEQQEQEQEEEETEQKITGPMLVIKPKEEKENTSRPSFLAKSNPFKVQSSTAQSKGVQNKGSQVFDSLNKTKPEKILAPLPVTLKISKSGNRKTTTLTNMFKKKGGEEKAKEKSEEMNCSEDVKNKQTKGAPNAFQLWLESNNEELREEHPDLSEEDFNHLAAERFKSLPKEERQVWIQKAKSKKTDENQDKKRKREETETTDPVSAKNKKINDDNVADVKNTPSKTTNEKLKNFAFTKE